MQLPHVIQSAAFAWFQAANVGTSGYPFPTLAAANMLLACGSEEQVATWVPSMLEGRCFGTMCLSETQAGAGCDELPLAVPVWRRPAWSASIPFATAASEPWCRRWRAVDLP